MNKSPKTRFIDSWRELNFEPLWDDAKGKNPKRRIQKSAFCNVCSKAMRNTSIKRLHSHRKSCNGKRGMPVPKFSPKFEQNVSDQTYSSTFIDSGNLKFDNSDASQSEQDYDDDTLGEFCDYNSPPEKKSKIKSIKIEKIEGGPSIRLQSSIYQPITSTSSPSYTADANSIDIALAKFFYGCQIPFETADSTYFKELIKELNPSYKSPNSETLTTILLDKVHNDLSIKQSKNIKEDSVLLIECKDNDLTNTRKAVALLQANDGQKIFLDSFLFSLTNETKEDFDEIVNTSLEIAQNKYKTNIYASVSNLEDSEAVTNIWHNSCSIESSNLLAQDIIDKDLAGKVVGLLKDFKQTKNERSLMDYGASKIILPSKTNWLSYQESFEWIIENLENMKQVAADGHYNTKPRIEFTNKRLLFNNDFVENIKMHILRLTPICNLNEKCRFSSVTIADTAELWMGIDLPEECQDSLNVMRNNLLKKYAFAANILHPTYRGVKLSNEQRDEGEMFIFDELDAAGLEDYQSYCSNGSSVFEALAQKGELTPKTFWGLASRKHKSLSTLANKLLRIPGASAQNNIFKMLSECNWGNIELDLEQTKKLMLIQHSLNVE